MDLSHVGWAFLPVLVSSVGRYVVSLEVGLRPLAGQMLSSPPNSFPSLLGLNSLSRPRAGFPSSWSQSFLFTCASRAATIVSKSDYKVIVSQLIMAVLLV